MQQIFIECYKEALKAAKYNEVPVGAVVVYNEKIIAKAHNKRNGKNDILGHAEIIAIKKASKKLKDWRLNKCSLYVTMKPCTMCEEIIKASRISNIYYLVDKLPQKKEFSKTNTAKIDNCEQITKNYKNLLQKFFENKRKN